MTRQFSWAALLLVVSCASLPDKKILKEKDYRAWQKDLALRAGQEPENLQLKTDLAEIALINEDFDTALKTVRELQIKNPVAAKALHLREIEILRYSWRLEEALARLDAYVGAYPKDPTSVQLMKRRPVIVASKSLPAPLKISPYARNPFPGFSFAEVMQAPEVIYLDGPQREIFAHIKTLTAIDQDLWLKPLGKSPQISWDIGDDADIHHFPANPARAVTAIEPPGFVQNRGGALTLYGTEGPEENLAFLQKRGCSLPAFSPWRDFFVASCKKTDHKDLILFRRSGTDWQESEIAGNINTSFDEVAPRISADGNYLFFASDGHPGYGAFDYYYARIIYNKGGGVEFSDAVNFGPQVNTFHNEIYPLQISPLADGIVFSAEGKEGLLGKATGGGLPRVQQTFSCRFIAYGETGEAAQPLQLTPLKGDPRPKTSLMTGGKSAWIRLLSGAQYRASFRTATGAEFSFEVKTPSPKEGNFMIERFSVMAISSALRLTYDDDVTRVTTQIRPEIEKAAARLKENPDLHVLIEGHADNIGGAGYNQGLSEKRAEAARKQFMQLGIQPHRITTRGWGQNRPLNANSTNEERRANRRIEILLVR